MPWRQAYYRTAGAVLSVVAGEDPPEPVERAIDAADSVGEGIATYCALNALDQATVRRELDPDIRAYVVARYGGPDGDVCTDDEAVRALAGPPQLE